MKNSQRGFVSIVVIVIVLVVLAVGAGTAVYYQSKQKATPQPQSDSISQQGVTEPTSAIATIPLETTVVNASSSQKTPSLAINTTSSVEVESRTFKYAKDEIRYVVDCGSEGGFEKKFASCDQSTMQADTGSLFGAVEYKIIGKGVIGCNVTFKYTKYPDPSWVNKEMTCEFDNKISLENSYAKVFNGVTTGAVVCQGSLYDILRPR